MDIMFPLKGLDTNHPRIAQPDGTSADLLNVVPFDRDYRGRGAVRAGLSKFLATQLGNGGQPITALAQVTSALDPSTIIPNTQVLSQTFTGADGTNVGGLTNWRASTGGASFFPFLTSSASKSQIEGNAAVNKDGSNAVAALYTGALTLGTAYIVKADVWVDHTTGNGATTWAFGLFIRVNVSSFAQEGILVYLMKDQINLRNSTASVTASFSFGTALTTGYHNLEIHVNGDTISGWVDGVQYVTVSNTLNNTVLGVGFFAGSSQGTSAQGVKNFQVFTGSPLAAFRQTAIVAVCGGTVYQGDTSSIAAVGGGTGILSATTKQQMAATKGYVFITDAAHNLQSLNLSTKTVADIVTTAGTETATTLGAYSLACIWRDRLVLAASAAFPQNFIMSRQGILPGTAVDFDYSQTDAAAAVAGNAAKAGAIGDPLNCLIPWTDDVLLLGGDHTIHKVEGDIAAGGQILLVSDSVGTLGPDCWDTDPSGNVYFVGSGGLYQLSASGTPVNLANNTIKKIFSNINRVTTYVVLTWDRDRNGLHIHFTPVNTGAATHIFYDATTGGFFPIQYPDTVGPVTAVVYDGDGPTDRQLLLAGRDGYVRKSDPASLTDDGTSITSYVTIGPFRPAGDAALSVLEALEVVLGDAPTGFTESDFQMSLSIIAGKDVYTALTSPERTVTFSFTKQARRKRLLQRISGGTFFFKITGVASKLWSLEKLVALFTEGGLQRRY